MNILLNLEAVSSQHNLKGLRRLYDSVESHIRSLKSLDVSPESYGSLLSSVILQKLPQDLRLIVSREISDKLSLDALLKIVEKELDARERASTDASQHVKKQPKDNHPGTTSAFFSSDGKPWCCYCRQSHSPTSCKTVTSHGERKRILKESGRCFICLRKRHISQECRSTMKCQRCNGKHHTSLCTEESAGDTRADKHTPVDHNASSVQTGPQSQDPPPAGLNPNATGYSPVTSTTTSMYTDTNTAVLLQTAKARIYNPDETHRSTEVRMILDSGSQRSYINRHLKDTLALRPVSEQRMSIKTFGSDQREEQVCDVVNIGMRALDGSSLKLPLYTVPFICEPLSNQPVVLSQDKYDHLMHLDLADSHGDVGDITIDILIGCDHYWKLVTGEVIRGPTAMCTKLGWVLSGPTCDSDNPTTAVNLITTHTLRTDSIEEGMDVTLKRFWELESLGIRSDENSVYDEFQDSIIFKNGRYQVSLPWKKPHPILPNNYDLSKKRLDGLLHRLNQQPEILREYNETIQNQLDKGIVRVFHLWASYTTFPITPFYVRISKPRSFVWSTMHRHDQMVHR